VELRRTHWRTVTRCISPPIVPARLPFQAMTAPERLALDVRYRRSRATRRPRLRAVPHRPCRRDLKAQVWRTVAEIVAGTEHFLSGR